MHHNPASVLKSLALFSLNGILMQPWAYKTVLKLLTSGSCIHMLKLPHWKKLQYLCINHLEYLCQKSTTESQKSLVNYVIPVNCQS